MTIRNELPGDFRRVEELTKKAFWNVNMPGCCEHYLAHVLRGHEDFIPELDFVIEQDGQLIGNVMYVKSMLVDESGNEKEILTFGPLSILPEYQRKGYGKQLLEHSFRAAAMLGYDTIVIFGNPENYVCRGFKSCKRLGVSLPGDYYPVSLLVKELKEGALQGKRWVYKESAAYDIDLNAAAEFDKSFEQLPEEYRPSQELFYIYSQSAMK